MTGAKHYAELFQSARQIGRLYLLPHYHARGKTFRIFVLPKDEKVIENHGINPPLNEDVVEVYGVVSGNLGWNESYGWLHTGPWQNDFFTIVEEFEKTKNLQELKTSKYQKDKELKNKEKIKALLATYK